MQIDKFLSTQIQPIGSLLKPVKIPIPKIPGNMDINPELNTDFEENSPFQEGVILETYKGSIILSILYFDSSFCFFFSFSSCLFHCCHNFHLVCQCPFLHLIFILFELHPNPVTVNTAPKGHGFGTSLLHLLLLLCICVSHGAFSFHCHPASNLLHRSLVVSDTPVSTSFSSTMTPSHFSNSVLQCSGYSISDF